MTHWSRPPDLNELQELSRESSSRAANRLRWYLSAFVVGMALVFAVGVGTNIFNRGPSDRDVSAAYRDGFDRGTEAAESYWDETLEDAWWDGYREGNADGSLVAPNLTEGVREGFSWDGGYEAGLQSEEISVADRYWEGWMEGFDRGWSSVRGVPSAGTNSDEDQGGGEP